MSKRGQRENKSGEGISFACSATVVIKDLEIKTLLKSALTPKVDDPQVYMKGIDTSYRYEGYSTYAMDDLSSDH